MNTDNQDKIWDYFQNDMKESFDGALPRLSFLCGQLEKGEKVLNIGVGNGAFEKLAKTSGLDIHSLDPSEKSIENIRKILKISDDKAKIGYSQTIPFDGDFFDAVVMSEVLEHLSDDISEQTFLEVKRVLKEGGSFLITVPFNEILSSNNVICPNCESVFHRWGHLQSFTKESLQVLIERAGFVVKKNEIRCFPDWSRKGVGNTIKSILRYVLGRFGVGIAQANIFLIARRKENS